MTRLRGRDTPLFSGCVAGTGLSGFWLVFTINGTAESEFSQWLICSKTGKSKEFNAECAEYAEKQPSWDPLNGREKPQVRTAAIEGRSKLAVPLLQVKTGTGVPCPYNLVRTRLGGGALGV